MVGGWFELDGDSGGAVVWGVAGDLAAEARAGRLLLTHLALGLPPTDAIRRASTRFGGPVAAARPGDVVSVGPVSVAVPTVEG